MCPDLESTPWRGWGYGRLLGGYAMSRLVSMEGALQGAVFELGDAPVILGRDLEAGVSLHDDRCSRRHARIERRAQGHTLCDLGSRNGIYVNERRVKERLLRHGDRIRLGGSVLLFVETALGLLETAAGTTLIEPAEALSMVGRSPPFVEALRQIRRVAPAESTVLLLGETGTGKELAARAIHANSPRRAGPLVAVNCAALAEGVVESELFGHEKGAFTGAVAARAGCFEQARGGTVFLDEVGELSAASQARLLRVLDAREFQRVGGSTTLRADVRVVAATHRDLARASSDGTFRQDLYFRLRVVEVRLPSLRERADDVKLLALHLLDSLRRTVNPRVRSISDEALAALARYPWPGNIRELRNTLERAVLLAEADEVQKLDLPIEVQVGVAGGEEPQTALREIEKREILRTLRLAGGNKTEAARLLGLHRATLYNKLKEYGVGT